MHAVHFGLEELGNVRLVLVVQEGLPCLAALAEVHPFGGLAELVNHPPALHVQERHLAAPLLGVGCGSVAELRPHVLGEQPADLPVVDGDLPTCVVVGGVQFALHGCPGGFAFHAVGKLGILELLEARLFHGEEVAP